jgi:hypothetical protein
MVEFESRAWRGVVTQGDLAGYGVEVRRQRLPWALYVLALTGPGAGEEPAVGFAVGRERLAGHLTALGIDVAWEDGRGPLAPDRDRQDVSRSRRRLGRGRAVQRCPSTRPVAAEVATSSIG